MTTTRYSPGTAHLNFFSENVDAWGAAEWFNRMATALRQQDAAVLANDDAALEICRNVAASSAMRLVRDYEQQVRSALNGVAQQPSSAAREKEITRLATITECADVVGNMRQSEAGLFDTKHSGLQGASRADALYDAYVAIRALSNQGASK